VAYRISGVSEYEKLAKFLGNRQGLSAFLMCLMLLVLIILPTLNGVIYMADKSVQAYTETTAYFSNHNFSDVLKTPFFVKLNLDGINLNKYTNNDVIKNVLLDFLQKSSSWMISGTTSVLAETSNFVISLLLIILTMFFFFLDGKKMLNKVMYLLPIDDKYNKELFDTFREISYTTMVSTFVVALAQGVVGAIGFAIVGFPAFLAGVLVAIFSLLPFGSTIFYVPVGLYYLLMGQTWQGLFIILWGFLIISTIDNVIRAWMLKDKAQINPMFVIFAVLGGIVLFGFWGVVLGPLIVSVTLTILHIYSLEFAPELDAVSDRTKANPEIKEPKKTKAKKTTKK
jgi:predicted PurR-regulated permease PerM